MNFPEKISEINIHSNVMGGLKDKFKAISNIIGKRNIAYIDYPAHFNTGDLLINIGTESFFKENNINVTSRYAIGDLGKYNYGRDVFDVGRRISLLDRDVENGAVIAFHGGGSFGDVWPHHHRLREEIIKRYKGAQVIVFPQSIQFNDNNKFDKSVKLFSENKNIHIFVRDKESLSFVEGAGASGGMLPDMAHHLWRDQDFFPYSYVEGEGELRQARADLEGGSSSGKSSGFDWDDTQSSLDRLAYNAFCVWRRLNPAPRIIPSYSAWYAVRDKVINNGVNYFQKFNSVKTDRLHGMILSSLLSKNVEFDDKNNKYRKLNRYYTQWLAESPLIKSA